MSRAVLAATCWLIASTGSAQDWRAAYDAAEYGLAVERLERLVVEQSERVPFVRPEPYRALATLLAAGQGTPPDPIGACMVAEVADMAFHATPAPVADPPAYRAALEQSEGFVHEHCGGLSQDDRLAASRALACPAFGMPETIVQVGLRAVRLGRGRINPADQPAAGADQDLGCPSLVLRAGPRTIEPPGDAAPGIGPRHFIELLSWQRHAALNQGRGQYILNWRMYEVTGDEILPVAMEGLAWQNEWPGRAEPQGFDDRLHVEMIRSGHVRWVFDGAPPKRGWIMRTAEEGR